MDVQNIYSVPPPPLEEHHKEIESLNKIIQGMQTQSYELKGLAQANTVITSYNLLVMAQLVQMTIKMNTLQAQLKTLSAMSKNPTRTNSKYYY